MSYHVDAAPLFFAMLLVSAFAQADPTPEQLEECRELGIEPEKCTEQAILSKLCLGMNCNVQTEVQMEPLWTLLPIFASMAAALAAGVIYVKKTRSGPKTT